MQINKSAAELLYIEHKFVDRLVMKKKKKTSHIFKKKHLHWIKVIN